jgi:deazaflavin-dependent oxidoreductase (nitroreductase family)
MMFHEEGRVVAVAASKAGEPSNPAWFHNLRAHPETTIQIGSEVRKVRARVATDEERGLLWPQFLAFYPGYDFFQRRAAVSLQRSHQRLPRDDTKPIADARGFAWKGAVSRERSPLAPVRRDPLRPVHQSTPGVPGAIGNLLRARVSARRAEQEPAKQRRSKYGSNSSADVGPTRSLLRVRRLLPS